MGFRMPFFLLLVPFLVHPASAEILVLSLGKAHEIPVDAGSSIHVGSKAILSVVDGGKHLSLFGKKVGETHLRIGQRDFEVQVVEPPTEALRAELVPLLKEMQGLTVGYRNGRLLIRGQLLRFDDWVEIAESAQSLRATYTFLAKPLPDVADTAIKHFLQIATKAGLPQPRLIIDGSDLAISLPAGAEGYQKLAEKTYSPYGIEVRITPSQVKLAPLVRTHVILAEISRDTSRTFGVEWSDTYEAKILPKFDPPSDLIVNLKSLESRGLGKILAMPNLLCRSGSEADFLAGGEIPIRTSKFFSGEIQWKKHGVLLKVKPLADTTGAISLDMETEVSILDNANAIEGIPALRTNRVHSHFDLSGRKTIALSGLLREDWGLEHHGLAGLASIPILGALFRSQTFQEKKSELVIFVTPEVLLPESEGDPVRLPEGWASDEM